MRAIRWLAIAFLLTAGWGAMAQEQPDLKAIVNQAVKAMGGEAKLAKLTTFTAKSKGSVFVPGEVELNDEESTHFPDKFRHDFEVAQNKQVIVFNGPKGWIKVGETSGPMPKNVHAAFRAYFHALRLAMRPNDLRDKKFKLSALGETKVEGKAVVGIRVSTAGYPDVNLFFDKGTHLPIKTEFTAEDYLNGQEVAQDFILSDYKEMGGIRIHTKLIWNKDGKKFATREITEFKTTDSFDKATFEQP